MIPGNVNFQEYSGFKSGFDHCIRVRNRGFLEISSSQIPSTCADVRIVGSNAGKDPLAVNGSSLVTPHPDPGASVFSR